MTSSSGLEQQATVTGSSGLAPIDLVQAAAVVETVRDVIGPADLLGAYLHGSAVIAPERPGERGLRPTSDLDILGVIDRATTHDERGAIVDRLLDISGRRARRGPARPVELTLVRRSEVVPWRYPPCAELQYGEWLRDRYEAGFVPAPEASPDLAILVTIALEGSEALDGPPPAELLERVPARDLRRAMVAGVPGLLADLDSDTRNVLLTLARIWSTLETRAITTKDDAAAWAVERLTEKENRGTAGAIDRARAMYLEGVDVDDWGAELPAARAAAAELTSRIEAAADSHPE